MNTIHGVPQNTLFILIKFRIVWASVNREGMNHQYHHDLLKSSNCFAMLLITSTLKEPSWSPYWFPGTLKTTKSKKALDFLSLKIKEHFFKKEERPTPSQLQDDKNINKKNIIPKRGKPIRQTRPAQKTLAESGTEGAVGYCHHRADRSKWRSGSGSKFPTENAQYKKTPAEENSSPPKEL